MPSRLLTDFETVRIAKTALYDREQHWLRQLCCPETIALARNMEHAIAADEGFPPGHYYLRPQLQLIESEEWQDTIAWLENGGKGHAALALAFIEFQMAYRQGDVTIIYSAIPLGPAKLIVLETITFPGRNLIY